jgi:hypothetical protein
MWWEVAQEEEIPFAELFSLAQQEDGKYSGVGAHEPGKKTTAWGQFGITPMAAKDASTLSEDYYKTPRGNAVTAARRIKALKKETPTDEDAFNAYHNGIGNWKNGIVPAGNDSLFGATVLKRAAKYKGGEPPKVDYGLPSGPRSTQATKEFKGGHQPEPISAADYLEAFTEGPSGTTTKPRYGRPSPLKNKSHINPPLLAPTHSPDAESVRSIEETMQREVERFAMFGGKADDDYRSEVGDIGGFEAAPEVEFKGPTQKGTSAPRPVPGGIGPSEVTTGARSALAVGKSGIGAIHPGVAFSGEFKNYAKFLGGKAKALAKSPMGIQVGGGIVAALASNYIGKQVQEQESKWLAGTATDSVSADPAMFTQELDAAIERARGKKPSNLAQRVRGQYTSKLTASKARGAGMSSAGQNRSAAKALPVVRETLATLDRAEKQLVRNTQIGVLDSLASKGRIQSRVSVGTAKSMQQHSVASAKRVQETIDKWNDAINGVAKIASAAVSMGSTSLFEQSLGALQGVEGFSDLTDSLG